MLNKGKNNPAYHEGENPGCYFFVCFRYFAGVI